MEPDPLAGQQVVVDRLAEQRVAEGVAVAVGDEDVHLHRLAQSLVERALREPRGGCEQLVGDPPAGDARRPGHGPGVVTEPVDPDQQHVGQVGGDPAAGAGGGAGELLDEERVALGSVDDVDGLRHGEPVGRELGDQLAYGRLGERSDGEPLGAGQPGPLGDLAAERVAAVEVVGAVAGQHDDRSGEATGEEEGEQLAGGAVGPVGVLDDEHERGDQGRLLEERVDGREQVGPLDADGLGTLGGEHAPPGLQAGEGGVVSGHGGHGVGELGGELAEHLGEGEVGRGGVAQVEAVAHDHAVPLGDQARPRLGHQPGLADAGVTGQQHAR